MRAKQSVIWYLLENVNEKQYCVYILANKTNVVIYIGVTSDLKKRVYQHKEKLTPGFAEKYDIDKLVYYEVFDDPENAIIREKHLKGSSRTRKNQLVESINPEWRDLYEEIWEKDGLLRGCAPRND